MAPSTLARLAAAMLIAACSPAPSPSSIESQAAPASTPAGTMAPPTPLGSQAAAVERSPDGIPTSIDGRPVLRGDAALDFAAAQTDTTSFLVGGWVTAYIGMHGCPVVPEAEASSWTRDCAPPQFADEAGGVDERLTAAITFRVVLDGLRTGPVIAEVHVHDPRAVECAALRAVCDAMLVVDRTMWAGDEATDPGPLTAGDIGDVVFAAQGSRDMRPFGVGSTFTDCGAQLPSAQLFLVESGNRITPGVMLVELEPSVEAMRRAAPTEVVACETHAVDNGVATDTDHRWVVVANAALLVRTNGDPTPLDRAFIDQLGLALGQLAATE